MNSLEEAELLTNYYLNQAGQGSVIFDGAIYQKGYGIGSFLSGLFRSVMPILRNTSLSLGRELVKGANMLLDGIEEKKTSVKNAVKEGAKTVLKNIQNPDPLAKISGGGYKSSLKKRKTAHSNKNSSKGKSTSRQKRKKKSEKGVGQRIKKKSKKKKKKKNTKKPRKADSASKRIKLTKIRNLLQYAKKPEASDYFSNKLSSSS